ncbi:MAG: ABC transporter substrate-binding protein [Chloroflexi bacterium]|nr:ABC transporter substrate-binding protein [Chloroflexota bacterium]
MERKKHVLCAACFLALLPLLMAACAPAAAPAATAKPAAPATAPSPKTAAPAATPKPAAEQPRYGATLPLPSISDPPTLDIHEAATITLFAPLGGVYSSLLQYDQSEKIVADLAERWQLSPDGKVYTFQLRKGVRWHDGRPFTSADARISLDRMNKYSGLKFITESVDKVDAPDENTLQVTMKQPQMGFPAGLAHGRGFIGPKHIIEAKGNLKQDVVGTGPFKFKDYVAGVSIAVVKNDAYFVKGLPYLDGVTYYIIKDAATRMAAFRAGRVTIYGHPPAQGELGASHVEAIKKAMPQAVVRPYTSAEAFGLMPNTTRSPWSDVRVRRAAFLAVDRERGLSVVTGGAGELGVSFFAGEWALPKEETMKMPGFRKPKDEDIAEAKRLLAEAGYPKGFSSNVLVRAAYPLYENGATFLKDQLAKIDIDLKLEVLEYSIWVDRRSKLTFDTMLVVPFLPYPDPDGAGRVISRKLGGIFSTLDDEETLQLFFKQSQTGDPQERKKIVWQLQQRIAETVPHVMLGWNNSFIAFWPEVKGYTATGGTYLHNKLEEIWLSK